MDERIPRKPHEIEKRVSIMDELPEILNLPLPEEVRKAVEEIVGEEGAKKELMGIAILRLMKGMAGEIRLVNMSGESVEPQIGKYQKDSLSALVKIVNENYMDYPDFFYEFIPYTEETLRPEVEGRPVVFVTKNHTIEGFITCYVASWGTTIDMLCVKRGPNRIKIEDMLISKVEEEAKSQKVVVFLSSDSRIADFEKKGYEIYGGLYHMVKKLDSVAPIPPLEKGVTLRNMAKREEEAITQTFYNPDNVGTSIFKHGFTRVWKEDWNHIAELNGKIVSIVCTRPDDKFNACFNAKRAEIWSPIALPEYRWKGFEEALMCRALNFLRERGMETASIVDTETPVYTNLYRSLGFEVRRHWKFLRK